MGGSIGTILLAAAAIVSTIIGFSQWRGNRNDERKKEKDAQDKELKDRQEAQDKELRAQAEERFRAAVIALGDEKESVQVGGAILLRSFLNKDDEKIYGRYYTQVFDLAVAYLRLVRTSPPSIDPDGLPPPSVDSNIPLPLTTFREALIVVFKEAFPLARYSNSSGKGAIQSLNARGIRLDYAYLQDADLKRVWMPRAVLRNANLIRADFSEANLTEADVRNVDLRGAVLTEADLRGANLRNSDLRGANLRRADLRTVWFHGAFLNSADLRGAKFGGIGLSGVHFVESATSLAGTDLRGATGLTQEQKKACKAKGAIIDEDTTANPSQSTVATSQTLQSNDAPAPSAASAQVNTQTPTKDGSSSATSQPSVEP